MKPSEVGGSLGFGDLEVGDPGPGLFLLLVSQVDIFIFWLDNDFPFSVNIPGLVFPLVFFSHGRIAQGPQGGCWLSHSSGPVLGPLWEFSSGQD